MSPLDASVSLRISFQSTSLQPMEGMMSSQVTKIIDLPLGKYLMLALSEEDISAGTRRVQVNDDVVAVIDAPMNWPNDNVPFTKFDDAEGKIHTMFDPQ